MGTSALDESLWSLEGSRKITMGISPGFEFTETRGSWAPLLPRPPLSRVSRRIGKDLALELYGVCELESRHSSACFSKGSEASRQALYECFQDSDVKSTCLGTLATCSQNGQYVQNTMQINTLEVPGSDIHVGRG